MKPSLLQKHTTIKIYKTLARPVLAYGCEAWTIRKNDETRTIAAEMWFMRHTAGCTKWDHKWNEEIMEELNTQPVLAYTGKQRQNRRDHVNTMDTRSIPKQILQYAPQSRRSIGWLAKDGSRPWQTTWSNMCLEANDPFSLFFGFVNRLWMKAVQQISYGNLCQPYMLELYFTTGTVFQVINSTNNLVTTLLL